MNDPAVFPLDSPGVLASLGILAIDGPDAATFLQGQATCDLRQVTPARGALGALCNLQGRMIVSFYVLSTPAGLALLMPRDRVQPVLQHLKKYAVFSKVTLRDDSEDRRVVGALSDDGPDPFGVADVGGLPMMRLRGGRWIGLAEAGRDIAGMAGSPQEAGNAPAGAPGGNDWRVASIAAGECLVDTANADAFLPQAFNYDVIDGVNFRKGCYTGQEVVARMHFKGRMKERLYVAEVDAGTVPVAPTPILDPDGKAAGRVVDAVVRGRDRDSRVLLAAVIRHEAARTGGLHLAGDGRPLQVGDQPVAFDRGEDPAS